MAQRKEQVKNAIGGLVAKIKKKQQQSEEQPSIQDKRTEKSEVYESKYVKQIIQNFNHVLEMIENQEREMKVFLQTNNLADDDSDSDSDTNSTMSGPKVFKAKL